MCGRFTLSTSAEQPAEAFDVLDPPTLPPRYNIAPTQLVAAVALKSGGERRGLALLPWGIIPREAAGQSLIILIRRFPGIAAVQHLHLVTDLLFRLRSEPTVIR